MYSQVFIGKICICLIKTAWTANEKSSLSTTLSNLGTEKIEAQENIEVLKKLTTLLLNNILTKTDLYLNTCFKDVACQE